MAKNILVLFAHPDPKSFNGQLKDQAVSLFKKLGHTVKVVDLYQIKFNPVGGPHDFIELSTNDYFWYQNEQKHAAENNLFAKDVKEQIDNMQWADVIYFQFPMYWWSLPAILKGWWDRIIAYHVAYGGGKNLKGKAFMFSVTTGGPKSMYEPNGLVGESVESILKPFIAISSKLMQFDVLPSFIAHGVNTLTTEHKKNLLVEHEKHIKSLNL